MLYNVFENIHHDGRVSILGHNRNTEKRGMCDECFNSYITIRNAVWFSLRLWSTSGNLQPQLLNYNSWGLQRPQLKRAMKSYGEGFIVLWFTTVVGVAVGVEVGFAVKH